jgi:ribosomal protein S18 acetylase RimI-like enzyme
LITEPLEDSTKITVKMAPIFDILSKLDTFYLRNKVPMKKRFFHLFMIGSLKEYRKQGIAKKLIEGSIARAKGMKFQTIVTEATNFKSQRLVEKYFKFKTLKRIKYKKFKLDNRFPFKRLKEESCQLMERKLI